MGKQHWVVVAAGTAAVVALTGCSTKASTSGGGATASDGVKTDFGVTDTEIVLSALTDSSGPFKVGGVLVTHGNELWAKKVNAAGGICGRQITLDVRDTAYKADVAVPAFDDVQTKSVGLIQIIGSAVFAAIKQKMISSSMMGSSPTIASENLDNEVMLPVTTTFDLEAINGLSYLQSQGKLPDGAKVGSIYLQNEAGQNSNAGVQAFAKEHSIQVVEAAASPTDTDMTATITKMKSEGVNVVFIAMPPAALASAAVQMKAQGLDVPLLGFNSSFQPSVLSDPAVTDALQNNFYFLPAASVWSSDAATDLRSAYAEAGIADAPAQSVITGYLSGLVWQEILETACEAKDFTRQGLLNAKNQVTSLDTGGLSATFDFSQPGVPPTRESSIAQVDPSAEGALKEIASFAVSPEAEAYKLPFQQ